MVPTKGHNSQRTVISHGPQLALIPLRGITTPCRDPGHAGAGSSTHRPSEGSQHVAVQRGDGDFGGPLRPSEGSQQDLEREDNGRGPESSSTLRGVTTPGRRRPWPARTVLIDPPRGHNTRRAWPAPSCSIGPHRPSKGSQPPVGDAAADGPDLLIAPTRDHNVTTSSGRRSSSSSTLREVTTSRTARAPPPRPMSPSALRGVTTCCSPLLSLPRRPHPHRPSEGSQRGDAPAPGVRTNVSSSILRGGTTLVPGLVGRSSSTLRGVTTPRWGRCRFRRRRSSSTLRGVTT
jgi:hypothetical protein